MNDEKIENMLAQLVKMVGTIQSDQQEMKQDQQGLRQELKNMNHRLDTIETKDDERHQEILKRFKALENDQDFIWEKTARNEREIGNIKKQLS
ncbi:hypothetical protein ACFYKT_02600 [Cytobacillus sp. FJAT-53684]|uniref:Uncharacterized protein n=1 Tax=Cytobacillus mangrovibacter TaxID=3299024 RepID=A0ABW6JWY0_9BACI